MQMPQKRNIFTILPLIVIVYVLFPIFDAALPTCTDVYKTCKCHASYGRDNLTNGQCFKVFYNAATWDEANEICAKEHSYLLHSLSNSSSSAFTILVNQSLSYIYWIGIKRKEGFYVVHDFEPNLFKESNKWGARWKYDEPLHDCVALDISSGHLLTFDCSMSLPFICKNNEFPVQPTKSLVCPEDYLFFYQMPFESDSCVRYYQATTFTEAKQQCQISNSSLASLETYMTLINNDWNLRSFWIENGTAICNGENDNCEMTEHPFICVRETNHNDVVAFIHPDISESFPSGDVDKNILTCDVIVSGTNITDKENLISYQWYKNGLPINIQRRMIDLRYYADLMKASSSSVVRQGVYHCEVKLIGSTRIVKSETINYFYSDVSTYVMSVSGMKVDKYRDYSELDFLTSKNALKKFMTFVTADVKKKLPSFLWEFHNISLTHSSIEVKFILYVNRSTALSTNSLNDRDIYDMLLSFKDKMKHSMQEWKDIAITIRSADFCFEEEALSDQTTDSMIVEWKGTVQTKHAVSEPLCLNDWKLQTRECKPSLISGADWLPFNYSTCTKYQPSIKDINTNCPDDFKTSSRGICFKVFFREQSWDKALETCSNVSSYLIDFNMFKDIASGSLLDSFSYWLPVKIYPNGTLYAGMTSENKGIYDRNLTSSWNDEEIRCAIIDVKDKVIQTSSSFCDAKFPFICVHHPSRVLRAFMFTKIWQKIAGKETCYQIESIKKTWAEANESCSNFPFNTSLIQSIHNLKEYSLFKNFLRAISVNRVSSWWMNLIQEDNDIKWLHASSPEIEFVDWKVDTNFNLSKSAGLIALDNNHGNEIKWILRDPSFKESSICEMVNCPDIGPTHAYVEDRTLPPHPSTNYAEMISKFDLRCVPSGWFLLNSISWYKDGNQLSPGFNTSRLTLSIDPLSSIEHLVLYQGYYWCSVDQYAPLKRIHSSKVLYKIPDLHTYVLVLYKEENQQLHSCIKKASDSQLPTDFLEFLKEKFPQNLLHAEFRSKSCDKKIFFIHLYFNGTTESEESTLRDIHNSLNLYKANITSYLKKHFHTISFHLRSTVKCTEEQTIVSEKVITWPSTHIKQFALSTEMCATAEEGTPLKRQCMGDFSVGAFWSPVTGNCVTVHSDITINLHKLASDNVTEENVLNSSFSLMQLTTNPGSLSSTDVQYASQILKNMADISSIALEVLENIVSTLDNLIEAANLMHSSDFSSTNISNELSASYESIISRVQTDGQVIKFARSNIALSVIPLNTSELRFTTGGVLEDWNMNITTLYNGTDRQLNRVFRNFEAGIVLPDSLVAERYKENASNLAVTIQQSYHFSKNIAVVSPLIAVSLGNRHVYDINPPIEMIFKIHEVDHKNKSDYKCAYWDQQLNEQFGGWSYKGCFSKFIHDNQLKCFCDHLTSFAVILELKPGDKILIGHEVTLSIITYVGCILSILGLGIIILTFVLFRKWRKELKHKALFNLSLALISFLILFLAGIENKNSQYACLAVAICLHFFMLASFAWMLVEALVQYLSFVKVIGTYIPCFMQKAVAFAWGTPLIIVITVSSINYEYYTSREKYCWLSGDMFYYAVATPILSMLILNFLIFIIILYSNTCGRPNKRLRSNRNERKEAITTARAMFCVSVLLGLSWIFGFLAVDGAKLLFQYLFALFATLQGFFMCVFFVFRQKSTRDLWFNWMTHSSISDSSRTSHITDITNRAVSHVSRQSTPTRFSKAVYKSRLSYILFN